MNKKGEIDLKKESYHIEEYDDDRPHCFQLIAANPKSRVWKLSAETEKEKIEWNVALKSVIVSSPIYNEKVLQIMSKIHQFRIPPQQVSWNELEPTISQTEHAIVRKGKHLQTEVAIKILPIIPHFTNPEDAEAFLKEIKTIR